MPRYHINKAGEPAICRAKPGNCPLGDGEGTHFDTKEEAQQFADALNEEKTKLDSYDFSKRAYYEPDFSNENSYSVIGKMYADLGFDREPVDGDRIYLVDEDGPHLANSAKDYFWTMRESCVNYAGFCLNHRPCLVDEVCAKVKSESYSVERTWNYGTDSIDERYHYYDDDDDEEIFNSLYDGNDHYLVDCDSDECKKNDFIEILDEVKKFPPSETEDTCLQVSNQKRPDGSYYVLFYELF